ncbi:ERD2 [Hepatospora eriocheir]|uniref:ERD2 n=1 Tax=Hepatospora eriocheir TaxID=1081669 RepID=A0A1X0QDP6_9MICR|nr:ERD2 [Hepatospora eriocheir]ORD98378.1 ERD2 [Hepatospora eriocheir]
MVISFIAGFILEENAFFRFSFESFCYKTSLILESIAILPQLVMIQESGECEILHFNYIAFLGMYRLLYLIYFICYLSCYYYVPRIILITSIIQTLLYADFFYILFKYILSDKDRGINLEKDSDNINGNSNILKDIFSYSFIKRKTRLNI